MLLAALFSISSRVMTVTEDPVFATACGARKGVTTISFDDGASCNCAKAGEESAAQAAKRVGRRSGTKRKGAFISTSSRPTDSIGVICRPVSWLTGHGLKTPSRIVAIQWLWFQARRSQLRGQLRNRDDVPHRIPSFTPTMGAPTWWWNLSEEQPGEQPDFWGHPLESRIYSPTSTIWTERGPCAPKSNFCSMSPEREGPVIQFTVRGMRPLPSRSRMRCQTSS